MWVDARDACCSSRHLQHTDLAIVKNTQDANRVSSKCDEFNYPKGGSCWVGLSMEYSGGTKVGSGSNPTCALTELPMPVANNCSELHPFICQFDNLILVKEKKTWDEALDHCRDLIVGGSISLKLRFHRDPMFDILSLNTQSEFEYAQGIASAAQMGEAWVGLRWLAGRWLWLDGHPDDGVALPVCPAKEMDCGTLSGDGRGVRDCSERRNFFCYQRPQGDEWLEGNGPSCPLDDICHNL